MIVKIKTMSYVKFSKRSILYYNLNKSISLVEFLCLFALLVTIFFIPIFSDKLIAMYFGPMFVLALMR